MSLQRQQLAESQVVDRRTRRVLHDDVLPLLHTAMLVLSSKANGHGDKPDEAMALLGEAHKMIANLLREMPAGAAPEVTRLGLVGALRKAVDDELGGEFDEVTWQVAPDAAREVQAVPPLAAEVLFYAAREAIRNAAHHGRQADTSRPLHLKVGVASRDGLEITVEDDGVGLAPTGRNNSNGNGNGGSGQGLALHSTLMAVVGGSMAVESVPGKLTRVVLTLPQSSSS
jgi:signal transduction histidine kinase